MPQEDAHLEPAISNGKTPRPAKRAQDTTAPTPYAGFRRPTANFVRCPNQYLDLCVPHCSLHVARLVGYIIRETIGWTGRNGEPRREKVSVSYNELVKHARVSRAKLRGALDDAIAARFIRCTTPPRQQTAGVSARSGVYVLRWDESGQLTRSLDDFRGFKFGGDCRTPLPNQFFDDVLRGEKHSVMRVVSAVLRHTVGFTNGITGERVEEAPLSYNKLLAFSPMDRKTLATALHDAEAAGYIRTVSAGRFSPDKRRQRAAVYAVRWEGDATHGSESPPVKRATKRVQRCTNSTRIEAADGSGFPPEARFTNPTSNGSDSPPEQRFTSSTTKKTTSQRQQQTRSAAAVSLKEVTEAARLVGLGFTPKVAYKLVADHGAAEVARQVEWLPRRHASRNVLGLLRRAIEEAWAEPTAAPARGNRPALSPADTKAADQRAREAYEHRHRPAYLAALADIERRVAVEQPDRHAAFNADRAQRRAKLEADAAAYPPRVRKNVLGQFDSEDARLFDFAQAFADLVPDFWTWTADHSTSSQTK